MRRLLVFLFLLPVFLPAQTPTASLSGIVQDSSGAVIADANVFALNTATGLTYSVSTDLHGAYQILELPPAIYDVTSTAPKFSTEVQHGVVLQVDERARADFSLAVGQVAETVQVSSQAALTDTESSAVGAVIDNRKVLELPLNARQFYSLALLTPGVY
jgi:hypothetical protein